MKVTHLFEEQIYLISNHAVARNPLFGDAKTQEFFLKKMEKYLEPICDVLANNLNNDEFQLLVRLKTREEFKSYYKKKIKKTNLSDLEIPESTYIFSQEMSNLQVSLVKHFNHKNKRSGTLMAHRFDRELVENSEEMRYWIERLNKGKKLHNYAQIWANDIMNCCETMTSMWMYEEEFSMESRISKIYRCSSTIDLGGQFINLPPARIKLPKSYLTIQLNQILSKLYRKN